VTTLSLLALLLSYYGTDTVFVNARGRTQGSYTSIYASYHIERMLSEQLIIKVMGSENTEGNSLSQYLFRNLDNQAEVEYTPKDWLFLSAGLIGNRYKSEQTDGSYASLANSSIGFFESEVESDILYSYYRLEYGNQRFGYRYGGPTSWSTLGQIRDEAFIRVRVKPCTLDFFHQKNVVANQSYQGDTIVLTTARLPFFNGYGQGGGYLSLDRNKGYSDEEILSAELWVQDTFQVSARIGLNLDVSATLDTTTNLTNELLTKTEVEKNLSVRLNYQPIDRTYLVLKFQARDFIKNQVDAYFDEDRFRYSFTGKVQHFFSRRPAQAQANYSTPYPFNPGSITFTRSLTLESILTPDETNISDRDVSTEYTNLFMDWRPHENLWSSFYFSHNNVRTHYFHPVEAEESNNSKSSNVSLHFGFDDSKYVDIYSSSMLYFSFTRYYTDSTENKASRSINENLTLSLFPSSFLQPGISFNWNRSENWEIVFGALALTNKLDIFTQKINLTYVLYRKEEWWSSYFEKEWLRIAPFVGSRIQRLPQEGSASIDNSLFSGIDLNIRPWVNVSILGGLTFTRSEYEDPFQAYLTVNSSF